MIAIRDWGVAAPTTVASMTMLELPGASRSRLGLGELRLGTRLQALGPEGEWENVGRRWCQAISLISGIGVSLVLSREVVSLPRHLKHLKGVLRSECHVCSQTC